MNWHKTQDSNPVMTTKIVSNVFSISQCHLQTVNCVVENFSNLIEIQSRGKSAPKRTTQKNELFRERESRGKSAPKRPTQKNERARERERDRERRGGLDQIIET